MLDDGFEEWDDAFVEKLDHLEQLAIAATQQRSTDNPLPPTTTALRQPPPPRSTDNPLPPTTTTLRQPPPPQQPLVPLNTTTHSPPRELSQRPGVPAEYDWQSRPSGVAAGAPVVRNSRTTIAAKGTAGASTSRRDNTEIARLKRELERVSKQLIQREQECLELRKERERKEVQLHSATLPKEARSHQAHGLRDLTAPSLECAGVAAHCLDQNVSNVQGSSRFGIGVQTEVEMDDFPLPSERETTSCDSLLKKQKAMRRCSTEMYSGSYLASKLFVVCDAELQVLFGYCKTTNCSKPKEADSEENRSHATSMNKDKLICSSDTAKVSRFYTAITRMSSGMVQFETFHKALHDLCLSQNAVIIHRSLRILHIVLLHFAGCQHPSTGRANCAVEATNEVSTFCGTDNFIHHKHHAADSLHASDTKTSCIEWLSLYQLTHQISNSVTDEPILYEAICIMNVILKRSGPSERERYGQIPVFQTVPKLLKKEAGFRVQKEAVHLLYLLVNCPAVLASLCTGFKESKSNSYADNTGSTFEGLSTIFAGLEDCLICCGTILEALELRRSAITLLSYLVSFETSGHEVLWSSTACNKAGFLLLILRLLASEVDSEVLNPGELTDTVKERTLLVREALILLNRIVSHPTFSGAALRALTTGREIANLTVDTTSRLSRKGKSIWCDEGITKQMLENEIPNLARMLYKRVSAYLGDNVSL